MDILCGYHAKSKDMCEWVLANTIENSDNITVQLWREACKEQLAKLAIDNNQ